MIQGLRLRTAFVARASKIQHTRRVVRTMATLKEEVAVCFPAAKRCLDSLIDGDVAGATLIEPVVVQVCVPASLCLALLVPSITRAAM